MNEAAVPDGPVGRKVLVPGLDSADNGDPEVSVLRAGGAALRAAPPAPRAATKGVPVDRRLQAVDTDASPCGARWHRSLIHMES
eukprot:8493146-Alexandrium_andersonii.AAC.1